MSEYAPGPWTYEYDNDGNGHYSQWFAINAVDDVIGQVHIGRFSNQKQEEANAQLICAAPDFFEAAEHCIRSWDLATKTSGLENEGIEMLRAAMAKAEGKA